MINIKDFSLHNSAERTDISNDVLLPTFYQHQSVYSFCQKFIKNKYVVEIGCGTGYGTYKLSKFVKKIIALDKDSGVIKNNKLKYNADNLEFICSNIEDYSNSKKADVVISFQVIEHLKTPQLLLDKAKSMLNKNGMLILSTPNRLTQSYNENPYHYKEYSSKELQKMLLKYFRKVEMYGLYGNLMVNKYEMERRKQVLSILNKDKLRLRRLVPRSLRQIIFDFFTVFNRNLMKTENNYLKISEKNYKVLRKTKQAIDLIVVCQNIK